MPKALHLVPIIANNNNNSKLLLSSTSSLLYEGKAPCWDKWRWRNVVIGNNLGFSKIFDRKRVQQKRKAKKVQWSRKKKKAPASGGAALGETVLLCPCGRSPSWHRANYHQSPACRGLLTWEGQDSTQGDDFEVSRWVGGDVDSGWGGPGDRKLLGFNIRATRASLCSLTMQSSMRTNSHFPLLSDSKPPPCESTFNTCVKI